MSCCIKVSRRCKRLGCAQHNSVELCSDWMHYRSSSEVFSNLGSLMFITRNQTTQILSCTLNRSTVNLSFMCCPQTHKELLVLVSPSDQFRGVGRWVTSQQQSQPKISMQSYILSAKLHRHDIFSVFNDLNKEILIFCLTTNWFCFYNLFSVINETIRVNLNILQTKAPSATLPNSHVLAKNIIVHPQIMHTKHKIITLQNIVSEVALFDVTYKVLLCQVAPLNQGNIDLLHSTE